MPGLRNSVGISVETRFIASFVYSQNGIIHGVAWLQPAPLSNACKTRAYVCSIRLGQPRRLKPCYSV